MPLDTTVVDLEGLGEVDLGHLSWWEIIQPRVDLFADDHQWIHVDPERAAQGSFVGTMAHRHLTLALVPACCRAADRPTCSSACR